MDASFEALTEATAGAVGGLLSTTILYPLDTCKTKYQAEAQEDGERRYRSLVDVLREAFMSGNVLSLYQGLPTKNAQALLSGFVYFYSYSFIRSKWLQYTKSSKLSFVSNIVVAAAAGACNTALTQPLDTLSARMQTSRPGAAKSFLQLLSDGGLREAYDGLGISLLLTSNPAIQYTVFEQVKEKMLRRAKKPEDGRPIVLSAMSAFLLGAFAKCVATVLTYPAIRCKVIMQRAETEEEVQRRRDGDVTAGAPKSVAAAMCLIWKAEGLPGFFKGLHAQLLKTVLAAALMLTIKEKVSTGTRTSLLMLAALSRRSSKPGSAQGSQANRISTSTSSTSSSFKQAKDSHNSSLLPAIERLLQEDIKPVFASIRPLQPNQELRTVGTSPPILVTAKA